MAHRQVVEQLHAQPTSDGAGVKLLRVFGGVQPQRFDPFLLLDEFGSDNADDYIAGFPPHPHRGFQTVTYMLKGKMEHRDHLNNVGLLSDGGVQWMTAGRGVIHSEMPKQSEGKIHGFQLWLNLPARSKMQDARYDDIPAEALPRFAIDNSRGVAIAGKTRINDQPVAGYFTIDDTEAVYLDVQLDGQAKMDIALDAFEQVMIYVYDGQLSLGEKQTPAKSQTLSRFARQGDVLIENHEPQAARFLVLAGKPLREKIAQYGPFVMNTPTEIEQALQDYRDGKLTEA